jgi:hypothetical protein
VLGPTVIVMPSAPLVSQVPAMALQSAVPVYVPSVAKVMVYRSCSAGGTTPWNAGVSPVMAVSRQVVPVRAPVSGLRVRRANRSRTATATAATIAMMSAGDRCCIRLSR